MKAPVKKPAAKTSGFGIPGTHGGITANPQAPIYGVKTTTPSVSQKGGSPPQATTPTTPATPAPAQTDPAFQTISGILAAAGLTDPAFATIAWNDYKNGKTDANLILQDVRGSDAYKTLFPNADKLMAQGIIGNEGQYLSALSSYRDLNHRYGIPASYDDAGDISTLLLGHVSTTEWEQRLSGAQQAALAGIDPTTRAELQRSLGVTNGDLTAVWLNPNEDLGHLNQQYQAGLIGAQSDLTGYGQLDEATLQDLAARGVTQDKAAQGFDQLAADKSLYTALPGQSQGQIDQATQLSAQFGQNAAAQQLIEMVRQQRLGAFRGGGGAAASQQGLTGLAPNAT